MICQVCGKNEATICMVKMSNNKKETIYICPVCAGKMEDSFMGNISNLLNPMIGDLTVSGHNSQICPTCGQTRRELQESGTMNCKDCYSLFKSETIHVGKIPKNNREELYLINLLKEKEQKLKKLIAEEKYEQAAMLRDEIKGLKEEGINEK